MESRSESAPVRAGEGPPAGAPRAGERPEPDGTRLDEAAKTLVWVHGEIANRGGLPLPETETLVARLRAALDEPPPLGATSHALALADGYTTTHALNVSLLSMELARHLAYEEDEILVVGAAGLLHDVGKVRLPLADPALEGLAPEQRAALERHPEEGARVLLKAGERHAVSAIVAHEHHWPFEGEGGYPARHYPRAPHRFSRLVRVCDTYDVLRSSRPFRPPLSPRAALRYLEIQAGVTLDPDFVTAFVGLCAGGALPRIADGDDSTLGVAELSRMPDGPFDPDTETGTLRL